MATSLRGSDDVTIPPFLMQVRVLDSRIELDLCPRAAGIALGLPVAPGAPPVLTLTSPARLTRTGRAVRLVHATGAVAAPAAPDPNLVRLVVRARTWWERITREAIDPSTIATEEQVSVSYVVRVLRLAFLSPAVLDALVNGTLKAGTDSTTLLRIEAIPLDWAAQDALYLAG